MEVEAIFPEHRVEPWHAVFSMSSDALHWADNYRAANAYGQRIVDLGFAVRWCLISGPDDCIHVIPTNDIYKNMAEYYDEIY